MFGRLRRPRVRAEIGKRYAERSQAEHYRDRFKAGRRRRTHEREAAGLQRALQAVGTVDAVLDVGCGVGRFAPVLKACARRLIQSDFAWNMLDVCRSDHPEARGGHVQADARHLPFASNAVDLVFCHRLLNHVPNAADRRSMLSELARVSRGHVLTSCLGPLRLLRALRWGWRRVNGRSSGHGEFTLQEFVEDARAAGLVLVASTPMRALLHSATFLLFRHHHA